MRMRSRPGEAVMECGEERLGQPHDPGERQEQQDAHPHGAGEPDRPPAAAVAPGSLPTRIEIKMTLSTPRTTSRNVRVTSAIRPSAVRNASMW